MAGLIFHLYFNDNTVLFNLVIMRTVFSHRQRYGGGGQSKKRRKNGEDIEMSALAPAPSGQAAENYSAVSISPTDEFFDEFTYKDIEALKELNCCMARKKEIRCLACLMFIGW